LQVKPEEIIAIMNDFNEPGSLAPTGLYLGGSKYMVIQGEPGAVIRGKKVMSLGSISYCMAYNIKMHYSIKIDGLLFHKSTLHR